MRVGSVVVQPIRASVAMTAAAGPVTALQREALACWILMRAALKDFASAEAENQDSKCASAQYLMTLTWASNAGSKVPLGPSIA